MSVENIVQNLPICGGNLMFNDFLYKAASEIEQISQLRSFLSFLDVFVEKISFLMI